MNIRYQHLFHITGLQQGILRFQTHLLKFCLRKTWDLLYLVDPGCVGRQSMLTSTFPHQMEVNLGIMKLIHQISSSLLSPPPPHFLNCQLIYIIVGYRVALHNLWGSSHILSNTVYWRRHISVITLHLYSSSDQQVLCLHS